MVVRDSRGKSSSVSRPHMSRQYEGFSFLGPSAFHSRVPRLRKLHRDRYQQLREPFDDRTPDYRSWNSEIFPSRKFSKMWFTIRFSATSEALIWGTRRI